MIVMKFGGTSVGSPEAIERVCSIVMGRRDRQPLVVVSAIADTTDRLVDAGEAGAERGLKLLAHLRDRTESIVRAVISSSGRHEASECIDAVFQQASEIVEGLAAAGRSSPSPAWDALLACGERISSSVLALALRERGVETANLDSRELFVTEARHGGAEILAEPTRERLRESVPPVIARGIVPVIAGFVATGEDGSPTTLGRGGSDYTASLAGAALGAAEVQIWTDVDGVMSADPSLIEAARSLPVLSLREASELAYFGGRVLHPATMLPAIKDGIPIRVLNSRRPDGDGTLILRDPPEAESVVKSIVYKENITLVDIYSTRMLMAHGFLARIFAVFEEHETAVDMVSTSEVSVSLTVDRPARIESILEGLASFAQAEASPGKAIVCVVGEGIRYTPGIAARVFRALDGIRIRMISLGASRVNVGFVVDEENLEETVRRLHRTFFEDPHPRKGLQP